jgi:hypothetical protein
MKVRHTKETNKKEKILERGLTKIGRPLYMTLRYTYDPYLSFGVSKIPYKKSISASRSDVAIFDYLEYLSVNVKNRANNKQVNTLAVLSSSNEQTVKVVNLILQKNLKMGLNIKSIRKILNIDAHETTMEPYYIVPVCLEEEYISPRLDAYLKVVKHKSKIYGQYEVGGIRTKFTNGKFLNKYCVGSEVLEVIRTQMESVAAEMKNLPLFRYLDLQFEYDCVISYKGYDLEDWFLEEDEFLEVCDPNDFKVHIIDVTNAGMIYKDKIKILKRISEQPNIEILYPFKLKSYSDIITQYINAIEKVYKVIFLKHKNYVYEPIKTPLWLKFRNIPYATLEVYDQKFTLLNAKRKNYIHWYLCGTPYNEQWVSTGNTYKEKDIKAVERKPLPSEVGVMFDEIDENHMLKHAIVYNGEGSVKKFLINTKR